MIQLTLQFDTIQEAQDALNKLAGNTATVVLDTAATSTTAAKEEKKQKPAEAPAPPAPPEPPTAPEAPAPPAPPAPAAAQPPLPPTDQVVTVQMVNDAAVAKATAMGDQGAAVMGVIRSYGAAGLSQIAPAKLGQVLAEIEALGV